MYASATYDGEYAQAGPTGGEYAEEVRRAADTLHGMHEGDVQTVPDEVLDIEGGEVEEEHEQLVQHVSDKPTDRTTKLRSDIGSRLKEIEARPSSKKKRPPVGLGAPPPAERIEYGLVSEFMTSFSRYGKHAVLYLPSRVWPGHIYRLFSGGGGNVTKHIYYKCCHCWKWSAHTLRPSVVIRRSDGMIVSDPDRPTQPHICTDFNKYPMFTVAEMYAEQIFMAAMEEVRSGAAADTTMTSLIAAAVDTVQTNVPAEHRQATCGVLDKYKKSKRSMFDHARRAAKLAMALQAASAEGGDAGAVHATWPVGEHERHQVHVSESLVEPADMVDGDGGGAVTHEHEHHGTGADSVNTAAPLGLPVDGRDSITLPLPKIRTSVSTIHLGTPSDKHVKSQPVDDSDEWWSGGGGGGGRRRSHYAGGGHGESRRSSGQFATFAAGSNFFDATMRRALQQELVRHERRIFMIKERKAIDAAKYAQLVGQRDFQHREQMYHKEVETAERKNACDEQHMRECNELARKRMQLENDMLEIKKQLMLKQLNSEGGVESTLLALDAMDRAAAHAETPSGKVKVENGPAAKRKRKPPLADGAE